MASIYLYIMEARIHGAVTSTLTIIQLFRLNPDLLLAMTQELSNYQHMREQNQTLFL